MTRPVLLTGATGYIGGRLLPRLAAAGVPLRCLVRDERRLARPLPPGVSLRQADLRDETALENALSGCDEAYYLVHAMRDGDADFKARDREQAAHFGQACARVGIRRIIYLGGLGSDADGALSEHLRSRQEVGRALGEAGVPVLEFRAAVIVGSGSASFEMLRSLVERLPVMITPRWVRTRCQPIGIADVLQYLSQALEHPAVHGVVEIGGADVLSYREMMLIYAEERGLRRRIISVPVLTPSLSALWVDLVTPIPASIARPLVAGLCNEVVVRNDSALVFDVQPEGYRAVVRRALRRMADDQVESVWCSSFAALADRIPAERQLSISEGMYIERHCRQSPVAPELVFAACCRLGGVVGWPAGQWLWRLRATIDRLLGGVGMRRGRRHPRRLAVGDAVDFWRVEALRPPYLLRLRAEMKLPGTGWLQFRVRPRDGGSELEVCALYEPRGLLGWLYWHATAPLHRWIFPTLAEGLLRWARRERLSDDR